MGGPLNAWRDFNADGDWADAVGNFSFVVTPPITGGLAAFTSEEVTGQGSETLTHTFGVTILAVRQFDCNGVSSNMQAGWSGVRGTTTYTAALGCGWQTSVSEFQRSTTGLSKTSTALYRDGHMGTAATMFRLLVQAGTAYDVRISVGDREEEKLGNRRRAGRHGHGDDPRSGVADHRQSRSGLGHGRVHQEHVGGLPGGLRVRG